MNSIYILLVAMHVGMMGKGNSNSITTQEFNSLENCQSARKAYMNLDTGTTKEIKAVCVKK